MKKFPPPLPPHVSLPMYRLVNPFLLEELPSENLHVCYLWICCHWLMIQSMWNFNTPPPHPSGYPGIWNLNFLRLACPNSKLCSNAPPNFFVKGKISNYDFLDIDQDLKPSLFQLKLPTPARQGSNSPPLNTHADDSQKPVGCLRGGGGMLKLWIDWLITKIIGRMTNIIWRYLIIYTSKA